MKKVRAVLPVLAVSLGALLVAGCGVGDGDSAGDPAALAPPTAPVYVQASLRPTGALKQNVESLVQSVAGVDDIGGLIVDELEESARSSGEELDFAKDIEPWLGEKAGVFLESYDGDDFHGTGFAVASTDSDAAQAFIDKFVKRDDGAAPEEGSYDGVDYKIDTSDDDSGAIGLVGDFLVFAEDVKTFEKMVDASKGDSLADQSTFSDAIAGVPADSLADVYADVGGLIAQAGDGVDPQARQFLDLVGVEPDEMTVTASLVPGSNQIELDVSSDVGDREVPSGDASALLGSLPASSLAAFASADFGDGLQEGIDSLDASGIPGQIPPEELKSSLSAIGIDLDRISGSIQDAALFVRGTAESNLGGALVLTTEGGEAVETVSDIGSFLRRAGVSGISASGNGASGFSIRDEDLGSHPLTVAAKGDRIAISYGPGGVGSALGLVKEPTLAQSKNYEAATKALGGVPISGYVNPAALLPLIESMVSGDDAAQFAEAKPYLRKARFLAVGSGSEDGQATAKVILGFKP